MVDKYILVDSDGVIDNIVVWDGKGDAAALWPSHTVEPITDDTPYGIGWRRVGDQWAAPAAPPVEIDPQDERLAEAEATLTAILAAAPDLAVAVEAKRAERAALRAGREVERG